jgi:hypothetical protein
MADDGRYKYGKIIAPEYVSGEFIGYTVWSEAEGVNYVRVKQHRGGEWEMIPVRLT